MGKVYRDGVRCCDGCHCTPSDKGMTRFGTILYGGCRYYVCPDCREQIKKWKEED